MRSLIDFTLGLFIVMTTVEFSKLRYKTFSTFKLTK